MTSDVRIISAPEGGWTVALGEVALAGFYGPNARNMAETHRDLLLAALTRQGQGQGLPQTPHGSRPVTVFKRPAS